MVDNEQSLPNTTSVTTTQTNDVYSGVWFFVEHKDAKIDDGCFRLAAEARVLADKLGEDARAAQKGLRLQEGSRCA